MSFFAPPKAARAYPSVVSGNDAYASGSYYPITVPGATASATTSNTATGRIYFSPFRARCAQSFDRIAFTNGNSVNSNRFRLGVFEGDAAGRPGDLLIDAGELIVSDTNTETIRAIATSIDLSEGLYWLAFSCNTNSPSIHTINESSLVMGLDWYTEKGSALFDGGKYGFYATQAYGALPASVSSFTFTDNAGDIPFMGLRAA